jgi:hypothetical protein
VSEPEFWLSLGRSLETGLKIDVQSGHYKGTILNREAGTLPFRANAPIKQLQVAAATLQLLKGSL